MSLFNELKRRNVFKVAAAYVIIGWLVMQIGEVMAPALRLPDWINSALAFFVILGFPFAIFFAWAFEMTPEGIKKERDVDRSQSITHVTGRKLDFWIIGLLVTALGYFAYDKFLLDPQRDAALVEAAGEAAAQPEAVEEQSNSIAVLPFVNMSSDPEQEYFADGISEEILNALAKVRGLNVAGRTSSFAFKGKADDLNAIGKLLRVSHILEGSVRKSGNRVRVTAQLIEVENGYHLWSETWDRELDDIFVIQDEISQAILGEMKSQLLGELSQVANTDTRAYKLYLTAKQLTYTRVQASLLRARQQLDAALVIDPEYAPALAQLGITTILLSDRNYGTIPPEEARATARDHFERALTLDPRNAEALAGMGLYYSTTGRALREAVSWLRQALEVNPNLVDANTWLSTSLASLGQMSEAIEVLERNHERDPLHRPTFSNLANRLSIVGRSDEALALLERLQSYAPGDPNLDHATGKVYWVRGDMVHALPLLKRSYDLEPVNGVNRLWYGGTLMWLLEYEQALEVMDSDLQPNLLMRMGRTEEALLDGERRVGEGQYPYFYLDVLAMSGKHERLIQELESRWGGLEQFEATWPDRDGYGADIFAPFAMAYRALEDEDGFRDAMARYRASLDAQLAEGADNWAFSLSQATYAALAGDTDGAVQYIETLESQGGMYDPRWDSDQHPFRDLRGDPRYDAARERIIAKLMADREALGMERIEI